MPVIDVSSATVSFEGRPALRGIDLSVDAGDFVALMGANGSGKSTLVRAIVGLRPLARGQVRLFGTPLHDFSEHWRIGYVPQRVNATSGVPASVREVVASGRLSRRRLLRGLTRTDRAAIDEALEVVGLAERGRDGVASLSGGQQQRVLIARALATQPELFVLDEPAAGVDLPTQEILADMLHRLHDSGATVLLVAHELGPMAPLISRTVVMRDGRIAYDGSPLDDQAVHATDFGHRRTHHHPDTHHPDFVPHAGGPLEGPA